MSHTIKIEQMMASLLAMQEEMLAEMKDWQKEPTSSPEAIEACLESKEPTSVQFESVAEH
jgi:protease II